ncbi:two-component sensor histidine kinase [Clostridium sp. CAG:715]|nr:two-component sensor histidine kinase [Clostridium sp. CAG:715]
MIDIEGKEHLLDAIFEYCEDIITVKDLDLKYIAYNKAFLKSIIEGDEKTPIIGKSVDEVFPNDECSQVVINNAQKAISELETNCYTFRHNIHGVNKIIKQTTTPIVRDGIVFGVLSVSRDVTREENLKTRLLEKNYQLNTLLENLPLLVYMKDKNRNLVVANNESRNFVLNGIDSYSDGVEIDMKDALPEVENEDNYVLQNKKHLRKEKVVKGSDGKQHWYKIHKAPIVTSNNEINGLVAIAKNIDADKKLEYQRDLFLATLSHDLKNPLQAQISSLEMLYREYYGKIDEGHQEVMALIIESAKYMKDMLCTLLKTYKQNNGIIQLIYSRFDILSLMTKSIREVRDLGKIKNVEIRFNSKLTEDEKLMYADENQLRRVIGNMLNNAINYAFENSVVDISIKLENGFYVFDFKNESEEISESLKVNIFDKYVCGNPLESNSGVGLGLYFCRKILEAHEGTISLDNIGTKNTFSIKIPKLDEKSALITEVAL